MYRLVNHNQVFEGYIYIYIWMVFEGCNKKKSVKRLSYMYVMYNQVKSQLSGIIIYIYGWFLKDVVVFLQI